MNVNDRLQAIDRFQQRQEGIGFLAAVIKKFGDDRAGSLAGLIAYYGFFAIFPLLLVFVTVLGFVLQGDPHEQQKIVHSTLSQFPIVGSQLNGTASLKGSTTALLIGIAGSLWAGLGITNAAQNAFNQVWSVPYRERPNFAKTRLRGLGMLIVFGALSIVSTVVAAVTTDQSHSAAYVAGGVLIALLINLVLFFFVFRLLTAAEIRTKDLLLGIVLAAVGWQILQHVGGYYVNHVVKNAKETYGVFATVIGLLAFLHLSAQIVLFAAEVTVVRARGLWPRSFFADPLTPADRRALTSAAGVEERVTEEQIDVTFDAKRRRFRGRSPRAGPGDRSKTPST
jgi:inner membrane protein YhjD